ncbi:LINE-1 retrotransposable element ORF2 protein [Cucumis melo var. makuwa]|uniref:LINE-1 retrotransposable element ORF2 protein n=1 Tax=Cucumis melo var. makuwa TaxID=1194695 RepID=A0A5D3BK72_CUCMM|nr:LINE-1 retrotransposable element ORF2 protein [Cucumis melo var. makuwa]
MWNTNSIDWDIQIHRSLCGHEMLLWNDIKAQLTAPNQNKQDSTPYWKLNIDGRFDIASVKRASTDSEASDNISIQPNIFNALWKSDVPKTFRFFI